MSKPKRILRNRQSPAPEAPAKAPAKVKAPAKPRAKTTRKKAAKPE